MFDLRRLRLLRYFVSYLQIKFSQVVGFLPHDIDDSKSFRLINIIGSIALAWIIQSILTHLRGERNDPERLEEGAEAPSSSNLVHNTINICLFPPLFFFYALYYTDILSALSVLFAYHCFLEKRNASVIISASLLSLMFRQTNIFWVSPFLGGLAFCRAIPKKSPGFEFSEKPSFSESIERSWQHGCAYDPLIEQASFEGHHHRLLGGFVAEIIKRLHQVCHILCGRWTSQSPSYPTSISSILVNPPHLRRFRTMEWRRRPRYVSPSQPHHKANRKFP